MNYRTLIFTMAALAISIGGVHASGWDDARSIAMAGSYTAVARGYDAIGFNPANLALPDAQGTAVQIFGVGSMVNNNAFSMGDYNKYNGAYLTETDKRDILAKIPDEGLRFRGNSAASMLSFSFGQLAVSTTVEASGSGEVSKDIIDLAFFGNRIGQTIDINGSDGEALAHVDLNIAYARQVKTFEWGDLTAGINVKYIYGIVYFDIADATASVVTRTDGINSDGSVTVRSAMGGSGFGMDLGTAATFRGDWVFSAGIRNLISTISWKTDAEETEYMYTATSLTAESAGDDSTVISDEITHDLGSFSTSLAPQINLGAAHELGAFLVSADLKFGLRDRAGVSTTPELSVGSECNYIHFLPIRAGIGLGGLNGASLGLGAGLRVSAFSLDFAWASSGTVTPSMGRGASLAISSGLRF
ncbi:MAG: hypothetical protein KKH67_00220 [candidate division Zixibacteria bacterium]|nr:hypothetical protein [candidate division Zixibacteria bacterium]MBU1471774.1 hypothetical protein [candidate division Zixibacteria bacterium]